MCERLCVCERERESEREREKERERETETETETETKATHRQQDCFLNAARRTIIPFSHFSHYIHGGTNGNHCEKCYRVVLDICKPTLSTIVITKEKKEHKDNLTIENEE